MFSKVATLDQGEFRIRVASNRPANVIMPCFMLEWFDRGGKLRPLPLTNGGSVALLHDGALLLRHTIDETSPFDHPNWRENLFGIRVAVVGFDEVLAAECSSYRFYTNDCIREGHQFQAIESSGFVNYAGADYDTVFVHLDRLSNTLPSSGGTTTTRSPEHPTPVVRGSTIMELDVEQGSLAE